MPCSGLQYSTECFFLTGGLLLHRRKRIRGLRSQNVHDLQSFQSKSVNKYNSVSLHLDLLSSASVFRQTPRTHTLLCLEITFSHSPGCFQQPEADGAGKGAEGASDTDGWLLMCRDLCIRAFAYLVPTENLKDILSTPVDLSVSLSVKAFKGEEIIPVGGQS